MRPGQKGKRNNVSQTGKEGAEGSRSTGRGRAGTSRDRVGRSPQWKPGDCMPWESGCLADSGWSRRKGNSSRGESGRWSFE